MNLEFGHRMVILRQGDQYSFGLIEEHLFADT